MDDNQTKTLIISPCGLPIPAVKGGAVLTLIESLIRRNEDRNLLNLTVVGVYDSEAKEKAKQYQKTNFMFLRTPRIITVFDKLFAGLEKLLHKKPHQFGRKLFVLRKLKKILIKNDFDSVVFENAGYLLRVLKNKKVLRKYRGKLFYHLHNDVPDNIHKNSLRACKLLLISNYLSKKLVRLCGEEIENNIRILHNGFDYAHFAQQLSSEEYENLRKRLNIPSDKKIIVFAGRIDPTKGIAQLTECFSKIAREDAVLLIIGSHNFGADETSSFAVNMSKAFKKLEDKIRFTGYVPYDEMWKYYHLADLAVLPSMWEEPMGLTIVEAMSAGLPVITTKSGGIPEFIDNRFGILLDRDENLIENMAKAINTVLDNSEEWKERGEAASRYIAPVIDETAYYENFCNFVKL